MLHFISFFCKYFWTIQQSSKVTPTRFHMRTSRSKASRCSYTLQMIFCASTISLAGLLPQKQAEVFTKSPNTSACSSYYNKSAISFSLCIFSQLTENYLYQHVIIIKLFFNITWIHYLQYICIQVIM